MKEYIKQMQLLAIEWDQFIKKSFPDEIAEFNENKKIKYQLFDLIVEITDDATLPPKKQKDLIKESILFLAKKVDVPKI